jgi:cysteine synthase B
MTAGSRHGVGLLERIGNTPLLKLERLSRWVPEGVEVYAKAEFLNPGGSVKDRAAKNMMLEALASGALTKDKILLDSTSGNTGIAYAMIGAALGIRVQLVMPQNASAKGRLIEAFGAKVLYTDPMEGTDGAQLESHRLYEENPGRYYMPDQYNNPNNWRAHYKTTAGRNLEANRRSRDPLRGGNRYQRHVDGHGPTLKRAEPEN